MQLRAPQLRAPQLRTVRNVPNGWLIYYRIISGYRVNYTILEAFHSIFLADHNEIWIIWSDLFPLIYFVYEFYHHLYADTLHLKYGLLFGIMTSRICSIIYHVFNCVSLQINQTLLYVDLIGIANMAFGSPYMYAKIIGYDGLERYCALLFGLYMIVVGTYTYLFYRQIPYYNTVAISQALIVMLGAVGNLPLLYLSEYDNTFVYANVSILSGYVLFYLGRLPERFMSNGSTDGKIYNSHVLWHCAVFASQYYYLK